MIRMKKKRRHFVDILRTARGFWKYCKKGGGGGFLALESRIICSSKLAFKQK